MKTYGQNAIRLLMAAVTGFRGAQFGFGNILSRYATDPSRLVDNRPTPRARKAGMTVAAGKRAAIKARNRAKHKLAVRGGA